MITRTHKAAPTKGRRPVGGVGRIRQNVWGNWYGYLGARRVVAFGTSSTQTAEQAAIAWLAQHTGKDHVVTKTKTTKKNAAAQALGRLGGAANTKAQHAARQRNAQRAGRPRRVCTHCGEPVIGGHVDRALDAACGAHGWRWQTQNEKRDQ